MTRRRALAPCLLAALVLPATLARAEDGLVLARDGRTDFRIVLPADATPAERFAAEELRDHLKLISGAVFPIDSATSGASIRLQHAGDLGPEEYRLEADAATKTLAIAGGRPRGVLYGVYALLEETLGCRWFTRGVARIPTRPTLALPAGLRVRAKPRLEYREPFWTEAFDGAWAARNRMNSTHAPLEAKHGGRVVYGTFVHTFAAILDPGQHFAAHPEWFSMVSGKRIAAQTQLCLTNEEVLAHAIRAVKEWIRRKPEAGIFSVSQNDWANPCECPKCKELDDAEGSHAGSLITFVNAVAEAIEKDHPGVAIDTLAYWYTRKPPRTVRPRPNVIVRLCSIECCFSHPLDGCRERSNTSFVEDLKAWNRLTNRLYVWDYSTDFAHYLLPFPNLDVLGPNVRTFADHGVVGVFEEGDYSAGGCGELSELKAWVQAKVLWDPSRDAAALVDEFVGGVYGKAAERVKAFLELQREAIRGTGEHVRIFDGPGRGFLNVGFLARADALLGEAEEAAAGDPALALRVLRLRAPIWYARVWQAREPADVQKKAATRLLEATRALGITHFHEGGGLEHDLARLRVVASRSPRPPAPGAIAGEDSEFRLAREGELVALAVDPKAEDGVAARQLGRTTEWSVQWPIPVPPGAAPGRYRLRARIRVEKKVGGAGEDGPAFHVGAYDTVARKVLREVRVSVRNAPEGEYAWVDVGELELASGRYAYVAPDDNEAAVAAIWTDRFELVRAKRWY